MRIAKRLTIALGLMLFIVPCFVLALVIYAMGRPSPSGDPGQICVEPGCLQLQHPRDLEAKKRTRAATSARNAGERPPHPIDASPPPPHDPPRYK